MPGLTPSYPFKYRLDAAADDGVSTESSKICHPRSSEAFKMTDPESCRCINFLDPFPNQLTSWR